ncbi:MAG: hypothetical protein EOO65_01760, partial [Methanosarcinales archaeon]
MYRLLTESEPRTVAYRTSTNDGCVAVSNQVLHGVAHSNVRFSHSRIDIGDLVDQTPFEPNTVVILDSLVYTGRFPTVVLASPGCFAGVKGDMRRKFSPKIFMPVPDEREIMEMKASVYSSLDDEGVNIRMQLWGPIPRFLFNEVSDAEQLERVRSVRSASDDQIMKVVNGLVAADLASAAGFLADVPRILVHIHAKGQDSESGLGLHEEEYYREGASLIASLPMLRELLEKMKKYNICFSEYLFDSTARVAPLSGFRGLTFEQIARSVLEVRGTTFEARILNDDGSVEDCKVVTDCEGEQLEYDATTNWEVARTGGALLKPQRGNEAAVDGFMRVRSVAHYVPVQFTVKDSHTIIGPGLDRALAKLGWSTARGWGARDKQVPFYFVVPHHRFQCFTSKQAIVGRCAAAPYVKQRVVCIPATTQIERALAILKDQPSLDKDGVKKMFQLGLAASPATPMERG